MTAELRDGLVVATEHIRAAPEVVFPYFTDPALIVSWIGERARLDPRPGGEFFLDMGQVIAAGTYTLIDPPHRVSFTWGVPGSADMPAGSTTVDVVLRRDGEDTLVVLTHRQLPVSQRESHRAGWAEQLARLAPASTRRDAGRNARRDA